MRSWLKTLERGVDRVTTGALRVAEGAQKAAGIGVGTVEVRLPATRFAASDTVSGTVQLRLAQPTAAAGVSVTLRATRKRTILERQGDGRMARVRRTEVLHDVTTELAGEGTYRDESFVFAVYLAELEGPPVEADGLLGDVFKVARGIRSMTSSPVSWTLEATVDLPWKRNVRKTIDLQVG